MKTKTNLTHSAELFPRLGSFGLLVLAGMATLLLGLAFPTRAADAKPPDFMTYQGYLVDGNGDLLAMSAPANYPVIFRIYDVSSGGAPLWAEQQVVTVDKGQFSVLLGEGTPVSGEPKPDISSVFISNTASERYIGISVTLQSSTVEILPRLRLVTSPYAHLATTATRVVDVDGNVVLDSTSGQATLAGDLSVSGTISGNGSGLNGLTAGQIPNLNANKITAGTLNDGRLSSNVARRNAANDFTGNQNINGRLGVGVANAARNLDISSTEKVVGRLQSTHSSGAWLALGSSASPTGFWHLQHESSGNLLIGNGISDSSSTVRLEVRPDGTTDFKSDVIVGSVSTSGATLDVRGQVKLGLSSQYRAVGASTNLAMVEASFSDLGVKTKGTGIFTSARLGTGTYYVQWTPGLFGATPTITVSPTGAGAAMATVSSADQNTTVINLYTTSGVALDRSFNLIAIGLRYP